MFWISKKTATYSEAWKNGFVDIHNHLLPGIDDGAKSVAQTEAMILGMQELGITEAVATPHTYPGLWQNTKQTIQTAYASVPKSFITSCSSEYLVDTSLVELAEKDTLLPLKGDCVLIEFAMMSAPVSGLMETLFTLKLKGYRLILAHPERYLYWEKNLKMFNPTSHALSKIPKTILTSDELERSQTNDDECYICDDGGCEYTF